MSRGSKSIALLALVTVAAAHCATGDPGAGNHPNNALKRLAGEDASSKRAWARHSIEYEVEPNARDRVGRTPLMVAAGLGDAKLVQSALDAGADVDVDAYDRGEHTALMYGVAYGDPGVVGTLASASSVGS